MLPKPPPREPSLGFLYLPPYRVQGLSTAGESTTVQVPELDLCFDMGICPRAMLPSKFLALSHGHMDHIGGLAYYCSQRYFQGMGAGTILCDAVLGEAVKKMMAGYVDLEHQNTPFEVKVIEPGGEVEIKNNVFIRSFPLEHTVPTYGFTVVEKRSKLKPEYVGLPQEKLVEMRNRGEEITRMLEIPLVAYIVDTGPCPNLIREDVRKAQILIAECTFFEPDHKDRAKIGMHMHVDDLVEWSRVLENQHIILTHLSRRTNITYARDRLAKMLPRDKYKKVEILMDYKNNKMRFERQCQDAGVPVPGAKPGGGNRRPFRPGGGGGGGGGGFSPRPSFSGPRTGAAPISGPRPPARPVPGPIAPPDEEP